MASYHTGDTEGAMSSATSVKRGGWITVPFIMGTLFGLNIASWGWSVNLIVFMIENFNFKSITATQVQNIVYGCICMIPLLAAIVADSFLGTFAVISVSSIVSLVGIILLTLTASIDSLRPHPCQTGSILCESPSKFQYGVLYTAIALAIIGTGGTRFTLATAGANQLNKPKDQGVFFNWFFVASFVSSVTSATAIVYAEESISWRVGLSICVAVNFFGCVSYFLGKPHYQHDSPQGSPFRNLARVLVASFRKRKVALSSNNEDYYRGLDEMSETAVAAPSKRYRFLNRAALTTEGDLNPDGSVGKPWRLCTVQQVEDLKTLSRVLLLWSANIFLSTPIAIQLSVVILQALTLDRRIGPNFKMPAGSMQVIPLVVTSLFLILNDRLIFPSYKKLARQSLTPLQRVGIGHILNISSMAVSAVVEAKRLKTVHDDSAGAMAQVSVLLLFPQLSIVGIGEAFHFPGNVAFCYQEFPVSLRSTATSMTSMVIGISFYLSTAIVDLIQNVTSWLPDDINNGRVDNVYWFLTILGALNFIYFLICASLYNYRNVEEERTDAGSSSFSE